MRIVPVPAVLILLASTFVLVSCSADGDDDRESEAVVDRKVYEALANGAEVEVFVSLRQLDGPPEELTREQVQEHTAEIEARVLSVLDDGDFTLIGQFEGTPALHGVATQSGIDKLAMHPDVVDVRPICCLYGTTFFPRAKDPKPRQSLHLRPEDGDFDSYLAEFDEFPLYWVGDEFQGLPLEDIVRSAFAPENGANEDSVSLLYGSCELPEGEGGCAPPVQVIISPYCMVPPELLGHGDRPANMPTVRGSAEAVASGGGLRIWAGTATVKIYGASQDLVDGAVAALVSPNGLGPTRSAEDLPPPDRDCSAYEMIPFR